MYKSYIIRYNTKNAHALMTRISWISDAAASLSAPYHFDFVANERN
jgi:hypothetical protein